jgi:integrative and conjugative element protein (TIGR02256 family)
VRFRRTPPGVSLAKHALDEGCRIAQRSLPLETGGIVLGWREAECIHVDRLIEVRDPNAQDVTYERNHERARAALKKTQAQLPPDSLLGYVGEWHTHPAPQPPSRQDRKELKAIARSIAQPLVMMVLATSGSGHWYPYALTASGRTVRGASVNTQEEQ